MESFSAEAIPRYKQCDWTFKMGKHSQTILHGQIIQFFAFWKAFPACSHPWVLEMNGGDAGVWGRPASSVLPSDRSVLFPQGRHPHKTKVISRCPCSPSGCSMEGGGTGCGLLNPILIICPCSLLHRFHLAIYCLIFQDSSSLDCSPVCRGQANQHWFLSHNHHCIYEDISVYICIQIPYLAMKHFSLL